MPDRPVPLLVEHAPRALPGGHAHHLDGAPRACVQGASFVDEMFRDGRISSVEWRFLRDAIWPLSGDDVYGGRPLLIAARSGDPTPASRP